LAALFQGKYGLIKLLLMKHSLTLENELAMIIEILSEMVENKNLTNRQMEQIMERFFHRFDEEEATESPSDYIVNNIMNYSRALSVLKTNRYQPISVIGN